MSLNKLGVCWDFENTLWFFELWYSSRVLVASELFFELLFLFLFCPLLKWLFWVLNFLQNLVKILLISGKGMASSSVITPEDVLEMLMNDGTIDALRLKIINKLKANVMFFSYLYFPWFYNALVILDCLLHSLSPPFFCHNDEKHLFFYAFF